MSDDDKMEQYLQARERERQFELKIESLRSEIGKRSPLIRDAKKSGDEELEKKLLDEVSEIRRKIKRMRLGEDEH